MAKSGSNHGVFSYGHIGADLITLASMLRIPVYMHNIEDKEIVVGGFVGSQSNGGGYNLYMQEPMNGGISIQYNF